MPAMVGVATWLTYVPIYTPLKTRFIVQYHDWCHLWRIAVLIGYTAAGGLLTELMDGCCLVYLLLGNILTYGDRLAVSQPIRQRWFSHDHNG